MNNENMMYCPNCGAQISKDAYVCPKCGVLTNNKAANNVVDKSSVGLNILSFFIPIVGLILYFTMKAKTPIKAKAIGISALIGFILNLILVAGQ